MSIRTGVTYHTSELEVTLGGNAGQRCAINILELCVWHNKADREIRKLSRLAKYPMIRVELSSLRFHFKEKLIPLCCFVIPEAKCCVILEWQRHQQIYRHCEGLAFRYLFLQQVHDQRVFITIGFHFPEVGVFRIVLTEYPLVKKVLQIHSGGVFHETAEFICCYSAMVFRL